MRAQSKAQHVPAAVNSHRAHLGRLLIAVGATLLLLLLWHPTVIHAQSAQSAQKPDSASKQHVVKAGETLWSIATRYYGDGHSWRALARRNGIPTGGDAVISVGQTLVVPAQSVVTAAADAAAKLPMADAVTPAVAMAKAAPPDSTALAKVAVTKATAAGIAQDKSNAQRSATLNRSETDNSSALTPPSGLRPQVRAERLLSREPARLGFLNDGAARASRKPNEVTTVFFQQVMNASEAEAMTRAVIEQRPPAPRTAEYFGAPYPFDVAQWDRRGSVVRRIDAVGPALHTQLRLQLADEVEVMLPNGTTANVGDRYVVIHDGGAYESGTRIGLPSGVLQVSSASAGQPVRATVQSQTGVMEIGDALFVAEGSPASATAHPVMVSEPDVTTQVTWVDPGTLIPSLQNFLLLSAGTAEGVNAGDEFELVGATDSAARSRSANTGTAGARIAVVRVVRTGEHGSTVVVMKQYHEGIAIGLTARRIAKMP